MKRLTANINSQYIEAANAMRGKNARRRIVAYVESYDDIYFWRTVLSPFENDKRYFEVMLPSKSNLARGKKSVLKNLLNTQPSDRVKYNSKQQMPQTPQSNSKQQAPQTPQSNNKQQASPSTHAPTILGRDMIACVDADYDYLMQGTTEQSQWVINNPYVFHTYAYAIENYQCYAPSLHEVCVSVTLNDHRIFDFEDYFQRFSEAIFPLFVWSIMLYRNGNYPKFSITDFCRICDPGGFNVQNPDPSIQNIKRKVGVKIRELQRLFPDAKEPYLKMKSELQALGVTPQITYLYIQGHHLFDNVVAPILTKVCNLLRQERQQEIYQAHAHRTQKRNEMSCYENTRQDIKTMLKKNTGYRQCPLLLRLQKDIEKSLNSLPTADGGEVSSRLNSLPTADGGGVSSRLNSLPTADGGEVSSR